MIDEQMNNESTETLSDAGQARRAAMRGELQSTMRRVHGRRRTTRRGGMGVLVLMLGAAIVIGTRQPTVAPLPQPVGPIVQNNESDQSILDTPSPRSTIEIVRGPAATDAYRVTTRSTVSKYITSKQSPTLVQRVDDDSLITTLADMGRPTGVVRTAGQVLLTAAVTDDELQM